MASRVSTMPKERTSTNKCGRVLRLCCCRYGWFPVLLAIVATLGAGFSTSSTLGCDFVRVDVGFEPSNAGWNASSVINGGFWYVTKTEGLAPEEREADRLYESIPTGNCQLYSEDFEEEFVNGDRAWKISRIMGLMAGSASAALAVLSWLFVFTNIAACFWQSFLLPLSMIAFVTEGSKFLLYDISLCRNPLWYPNGVDSESQAADSCGLGESARWGLVAASLLLTSLLMVCLRLPKKKELDDLQMPSSSGTVTRREHLNDTEEPNNRNASLDIQGDESYDDFTDELPYDSHYSESGSSEQETPLDSSLSHSLASEDISLPNNGGPSDASRISESRLQKLRVMRENAAANSNSSLVENFVQDVEMQFSFPESR